MQWGIHYAKEITSWANNTNPTICFNYNCQCRFHPTAKAWKVCTVIGSRVWECSKRIHSVLRLQQLYANSDCDLWVYYSLRTYGLTGATHGWIFHHLVSCHTLAGVGPVCVVTELTACTIDIALIEVYRVKGGRKWERRVTTFMLQSVGRHYGLFSTKYPGIITYKL